MLIGKGEIKLRQSLSIHRLQSKAYKSIHGKLELSYEIASDGRDNSVISHSWGQHLTMQGQLEKMGNWTIPHFPPLTSFDAGQHQFNGHPATPTERNYNRKINSPVSLSISEILSGSVNVGIGEKRCLQCNYSGLLHAAVGRGPGHLKITTIRAIRLAIMGAICSAWNALDSCIGNVCRQPIVTLEAH